MAAQGIKHLYNEARNPRPDLTVPQLAEIMARTFDALDLSGFAGSVIATTNTIVSALWTQTGNSLYPTQFSTATVLIGTKTTDVGFGTSANLIIFGGFFAIINNQTNTSLFGFTIAGGACNITSNRTGTGAVLPIAFGTPLEIARFNVAGTLLMGLNTTDVGVGTAGNIVMIGFLAIVTASVNASLFALTVVAGTSCNIVSNRTGTGTVLPITFGLPTEVARFTTAGVFLAGATSSDFFTLPGQIASSIGVGVQSATTNASIIQLGTSANRVFVQSSKSGSGTTLPIGFAIVSTFTVIMDVNGALLCNFLSYDGSAAGRIIGSSWVGSSNAGSNSTVVYLLSTGAIETQLISDATGTGTLLHFSVYTGAATRHSTFRTDGSFIVGLLSADAFNTAGTIVATGAGGMGLVTASTNADVFKLQQASSLSQIKSTHTGIGVTRPIAFFFDNTEVARFNTFGTLLMGLTTTDVGVSSAGNIVMTGFLAFVTATANASLLGLSVTAGTSCNITSNATGSGTVLPLVFGMPTEAMRILANKDILMNRTTDDSSAATLQVSANSSLFAFSCTGSGDNTSRFVIRVSGGVTVIGVNGATAIEGETVATSGGTRNIHAGLITG